MKFATRISSIRRIAWKRAGRARRTRARCAPTRWPASALAGWTRSPSRLAAPRSPGAARASRSRGRGAAARSSSAIARSRRAWPSPIGEETIQRPLRRRAAARPRRAARRAAARSTNSRSSRLTCTGSRAVRHVAGALERDELRRRSARPAPRRRACGRIAVVGRRGSTSTGQRDRAQQRRANVLARRACRAPRVVSAQRLGVGLEPPADAVLDLLGRVRLGEHLAEEELEEAAVVAAASSGGCTSPSPRRCRARSSKRVTRRARVAGRERHRRADDDDAAAPARGARRRAASAQRRAARERRRATAALGAGRVEHRERVGGELARRRRPRRRAGRSERPLPRPSKVTTRKWRARYGICAFQSREWTIDHVGSSSDRRLAVAVDLVEDAHAVALDEALLVGIAGARLLARAARVHGRSSPSRPRLEHEVERRLGRAAEAA